MGSGLMTTHPKLLCKIHLIIGKSIFSLVFSHFLLFIPLLNFTPKGGGSLVQGKIITPKKSTEKQATQWTAGMCPDSL